MLYNNMYEPNDNIITYKAYEEALPKKWATTMELKSWETEHLCFILKYSESSPFERKRRHIEFSHIYDLRRKQYSELIVSSFNRTTPR